MQVTCSPATELNASSAKLLSAERVFVSDLHLSEAHPKLVSAHAAFVEALIQAKPKEFYLLGDWFDAYLGSDMPAPWLEAVKPKLLELSCTTSIFVQRGNRDFALDQALLDPIGAQLLASKHLLHTAHCKVQLSHGDEMCTLDTGYLRMKRVLHAPFTISVLHKTPLSFRRWLAARLSRGGGVISAEKLKLMQVTDQSAIEALQQVDLLVHGHTHTPGVYEHKNGLRVTLGDWREHADSVTTHVGVMNQDHFELLPLVIPV